jgi:hypothetical protein
VDLRHNSGRASPRRTPALSGALATDLKQLVEWQQKAPPEDALTDWLWTDPEAIVHTANGRTSLSDKMH